MASSSTRITVVERCTVAPPPRSVAATSLPLTFFDVPWLLFTPSQPLFFYNLPTSTAQFRQTILPNLKHSLSLTLQHFYTLAGKLLTPPISAEPTIEYNEGDSITLTVSEAAGDDDQIFKNLAGDHPRTARDFEGLVPMLGLDDDNDVSIGQPILAIQVTVFPGCGICVGFALRHVAADERTFNNFLKTWASLVGGVWGIDKSVASHDREGIRDHVGLKSTLLKHWWDVKHLHKEGSRVNGSSCNDVLRATFVLGPKEMEKIKNWILARSEMLFGSTQLLLSPYVLTCAFVWVCWVKAHWSGEDRGELKSVHYFGFVAGGLTRLSYMVPRTYVGNCVGFGRARALRNELIGENGIAFAAKAIGDTVKKLNKCFLNDAEHWISEWEELRESEFHVTVTGSPKVDLYELDFGWGRPVKIEQASIETTRAISLCQGREVVGSSSIEIGLALPKSKLDAFSTMFYRGVN